MSKLLRVGLVGCGLIADDHLRAYGQHADRARITACFDIDASQAARRAEEAGGASVAVSLGDVLSDPDIDSVEICTPPHLHPEAVIAAARAGKHILCQKPLGRALAECDAMIGAAREAGVTLFYGETNNTLPAAALARNVIAEGRIGRLVGLQGTFAFWQGGKYLSTARRYDPAVAGGGQLLDSGIHAVALLRGLGGPVRSVQCVTNHVRPELGGEDTAALTLRFEGGHLGTLFSSQAVGVWGPYPNCTVLGTEGVLALGGPFGALTLHRPDLPDRREVLMEPRPDGFTAMIGRYLDTVLDGAPNLSPGESGREDLRVVLAAYESARTGREIILGREAAVTRSGNVRAPEG